MTRFIKLTKGSSPDDQETEMFQDADRPVGEGATTEVVRPLSAVPEARPSTSSAPAKPVRRAGPQTENYTRFELQASARPSEVTTDVIDPGLTKYVDPPQSSPERSSSRAPSRSATRSDKDKPGFLGMLSRRDTLDALNGAIAMILAVVLLGFIALMVANQ